MVLKSLYALSFIDLISFGLLAPTTNLQILSLGGNKFIIGFLASTHNFLQLLTSPIVGSWSDEKGRKPALLVILLITLLSYILLGFNSLYVYIASRVLIGISGHTKVLFRALLADHVSNEEQSEIYAKLGALGAFAFIAGPVVGGHIAEAKFGFFKLSLVLSALTVISLGIVFNLRSTESKETQTQSGFFQAFKTILTAKWRILISLNFLISIVYAFFYQTFGLMLNETYGASHKEVGYVIAFHSLILIFANLAMKRIKSAFNDSKSIGLASVLGLLISFTVLFMFPGFWALVAFMVPFSFLRTILDNTLNDILIGKIPEGEKGQILGAYDSVDRMAGLVTPIICGFIAEYFGYNICILMCTVPLIVILGLITKLDMKLD